MAAIFGMKKGRLCGGDAFSRMLAQMSRPVARTWMAWSERDLYAAMPSTLSPTGIRP